jgi:PII-like signaling protein
MSARILRICMPLRAQRKGKLSFWQKVFLSSLPGYLLSEAKAFGVEQAIFQRIFGGYLIGKKLVFEQAEVMPPDLPQCVKLVDEEKKLRDFVEKYRDQIEDCRVVLFKTVELLR